MMGISDQDAQRVLLLAVRLASAGEGAGEIGNPREVFVTETRQQGVDLATALSGGEQFESLNAKRA